MAAATGGAKPDEAFSGICRAIRQALMSPVGADRNVFLGAVDLCHAAVAHLSPALSALDLNMGLTSIFPSLLERTSSLSGTGDVKLSVASDRLVQQLAKHPKVGCEATTKMIVAAVARSEYPQRPLMLLGTLLSVYGLRICGQRDIVSQVLSAIASQLEGMNGSSTTSTGEKDQDFFTLRAQLIDVLATCSQFSPDTFKQSLAAGEVSQRKLLMEALREAPNPQLVALGAAAAEQAAVEASGSLAAGSGARSLLRQRASESRANLAAAAAQGSNPSSSSSPSTGLGSYRSPPRAPPPQGRSRAGGSGLEPLAPLAPLRLRLAVSPLVNIPAAGQTIAAADAHRQDSHESVYSDVSTAASSRCPWEKASSDESARFGDSSPLHSADSSLQKWRVESNYQGRDSLGSFAALCS
jgi:hypothetical protein